ncbi:MAG: hypothetical protein MZV70_67175 [Desulfobacterales bacterium]|nr:hypothetical protein [Desulfobacterales bacterium]
MDVVIVDTAGRLHTKVNLMEEIKKVKRSIAKRLPEAPHEVLLVLDATTGPERRLPGPAVPRGARRDRASRSPSSTAPPRAASSSPSARPSTCRCSYIGIGESIEDLQDFDPEQFVEALVQRGTERGAFAANTGRTRPCVASGRRRFVLTALGVFL